MTGIVGGAVTGKSLRSMADSMTHEPWYEVDLFEEGSLGLGLLHHGERDPGEHATWRDGARAGVVYGALTNLDDLGLDIDAFFDRLFDAPERTLRAVDGPFSVAAIDGAAARTLLATDKIGSRPCYYREAGELLFGSELKAILALVDDPVPDEQAINDLLLIGHMWSERTLVEEIQFVPPGSVLDHRPDEATLTRYWTPTFDEADPGQRYLNELVCTYRDALDDVAATMYGDVGVWLSGGLDSRPIISELARNCDGGGNYDSLTAYTYDSNPPGAGNPELARRIADVLDVPICEVEVSADRILEVIDRAVDITDGMLRWTSVTNLSSVFHLDDDRPGVMLEGAGQGELIGHHLRHYHLTGCDSLVESMYRSEQSVDRAIVDDLSNLSVDPLGSFKAAAEASEESTFQNVLKDVHFRHYYSKYQLLSDQLARSQVGTRVPYVDGDFLAHAARLPLAYRMKTYPLTSGKIPYGATEPKLELMRQLHPKLARIPYERTSVPPSLPMPAHMAGFFLSTSYDRLTGKTTYGGRSMIDDWYRSHPAFRRCVDDVLTDAYDRQYFDEDAIKRLQTAHLSGTGNHMNALSPVMTVEMWLQKYVD